MALSLVEPAIRVVVDVTFLRMAAPPGDVAPPLPAPLRLVKLGHCTVPFYRYLYNTVGQDYVWWLRRAASDGELAAILGDPAVSIHVLYRDGEPAGFFELERRASTGTTNIAYFGLLPHMVGKGAGAAFLRAAIDTAWEGASLVTVNTCTADHPRALPNYQAAGFTKLRTVLEVWPVPVRLGLTVPDRLLA